MKARAAVLVLLLAAAAFQAVHYYPVLPSRMASHFDGAGAPNGWSTPGGFFAIMLGLELILALSWWSVGPFTRRLPPEQINLPNRDYWLAPERRELAIDRFQGLMLEFGIMIELLLVYVTQLVVKANLSTPVILSSNISVALGAFAIATVVWVTRTLKAFPRPDPAA